MTSKHLDRIASVSIRQSTMLQVRTNTASTERQYQLRQRADDLGWPQEQIIVSDEDLGLSGASSADRPGFQRLVLDVSLERVGAVLALEVSRLARSSRDWSRLMELCALTNCLVIDDDGVSDPNNINDRLVLGLKGTISEYELHLIKTRMLQGKLHKTQQGQLRVRLPVGYLDDVTKQAVFDPDEQVQHAIRLAFDLFEQLGSAWAVVKSFRTQHRLFPTRHVGGTHHGQLTWSPLRAGTSAALANPETDSSGKTGPQKHEASRKPHSPSQKNPHAPAVSPSSQQPRSATPEPLKFRSGTSERTQENPQSQASSPQEAQENLKRGQ